MLLLNALGPSAKSRVLNCIKELSQIFSTKYYSLIDLIGNPARERTRSAFSACLIIIFLQNISDEISKQISRLFPIFKLFVKD